MISAVNAFKTKLDSWSSQIQRGRLNKHFTNLDKVFQNLKDKTAFHPEQFCAILCKLTSEFDRRFVEVQRMSQVAAFFFLSNPFLTTECTDIEQLSDKLEDVFAVTSDIEMEITG